MWFMFNHNNNTRFEVVYSEGNDLTMEIRILLDKATGIHYLFAKSGQSAGLTPLLNDKKEPSCLPLDMQK